MAESYFLKLHFEMNGTIQLRGLIWPQTVSRINVEFSKYPDSPFTKEIIEELVCYTESQMSTSSNASVLMKEYNLTQIQAKHLASLVMKNQFHYCENSCQNCKEPVLPVLISQILQSSSVNFDECFRFKAFMIESLKSQSKQDIEVKKTENWLLEMFENANGEIINNKSIRIKIQDKVFTVEFDERLWDLFDIFLDRYPDFDNAPIIAVYHYASSNVMLQDVGGILLKREGLKDSYVTDYNISLLKVFDSHVNMGVYNGNGMCKFYMKESQSIDEMFLENNGIFATHQDLR